MEKLKQCMRAVLDEYVETPTAQLGESFALKLEALDQLIDAFVADAARFAAIRLLLCETDEAKRTAMVDVLEHCVVGWTEIHQANALTPDLVDELFDRALAAVGAARAGVSDADR